MRKIKCIIKRPDEKYGHVTNISPRFENLQKTVGGNIQILSAIRCAVILCNEDGKLQGLEPNLWYFHDRLVGTIIVIGIKDGEFDDIPISLAEWKVFVDKQEELGPL